MVALIMIAGIDSSSDASLIGISQLQALVKHTTLFQHLKDGIIWRHDPKGQFSVQKLSAILLHSDNGNTFKTIWSIAVPRKIQSFIWMVLIDRIPSTSFLIQSPEQSLCPMV